DMQKVQEEMKDVEAELKNIEPKLEESMRAAKIGMEKAKEELKAYKSFVDGLDKDGLINKNETYSIEHKNGELIINGKKQPAEIYEKYRDFLQKHKEFKIKKTGDDFNIYNDDHGDVIRQQS
ncbi:MAG TPA: hypothetical protein VGC95_06515, partial [Chitinophagaceae bacterium]